MNSGVSRRLNTLCSFFNDCIECHQHNFVAPMKYTTFSLWSCILLHLIFYFLYVIGQVLNFLLSLLLLCTLKHLITRLKKTWLRHFLPLDDSIFLHKLTAVVAFVFGAVHAVAHIVLIGEELFLPYQNMLNTLCIVKHLIAYILASNILIGSILMLLFPRCLLIIQDHNGFLAGFQIVYRGKSASSYVSDWKIGSCYVSGFALSLFAIIISVLSSKAVKQKSYSVSIWKLC